MNEWCWTDGRTLTGTASPSRVLLGLCAPCPGPSLSQQEALPGGPPPQFSDSPATLSPRPLDGLCPPPSQTRPAGSHLRPFSRPGPLPGPLPSLCLGPSPPCPCPVPRMEAAPAPPPGPRCAPHPTALPPEASPRLTPHSRTCLSVVRLPHQSASALRAGAAGASFPAALSPSLGAQRGRSWDESMGTQYP